MMQHTVAHARTETAPAVWSAGASGGLVEIPWRQLVPMARIAVMLLSFFVLVSSYMLIRVNVTQMHKEVDTIGRMIARAEVANAQLRLEIDARGRTRALEMVALDLGLQPVTAAGATRHSNGGLAAGGQRPGVRPGSH
jgi:hypothetical protein